ncbi:GNAT family N-acetyltransferase [Haloechinothrix sp. YIM 98757]|uniref:GNAT family N-acetyltransferase n=1 Tax=Haloechinothrix aidingensis TaxID=2752311 RepID=A0A838A793_9PSEU|nr:GNAT family N-acetyltransferase [Haloechinothrix aidingensis]MBA0125840.1 GNAT family N-acetyltransferase [Haloechinothrix aidingensis]
MSRTVVRRFDETDRADLHELFGRAGEGTPPDALWGHAESEAAVYLTPYADLQPDSLFLAVLDGELVGYLAGCLDNSALPSERERMARAIRMYRLPVRPAPAAFLARSMLDTARSALRGEPAPTELDDPRWPAHLHINLVRKARGTGLAATLMDHWFDRLRRAGSRGCYLQTLVENARAVRFFERMGFEKYGPTPRVPGIRHRGQRLHQQTMVWSP